MRITELLKSALSLFRKGQRNPLESKLVEAHETILKLQGENKELRRCIQEIAEKATIQSQLFENVGILMPAATDGRPCCPVCRARDGKLIPLHGKDHDIWVCHVCHLSARRAGMTG